MSKRSRVSRKERLAATAAVEMNDPAALAALAVYANGLRPIVTTLRSLAEDATAPTGTRVRSRTYLRAEVLRYAPRP